MPFSFSLPPPFAYNVGGCGDLPVVCTWDKGTGRSDTCVVLRTSFPNSRRDNVPPCHTAGGNVVLSLERSVIVQTVGNVEEEVTNRPRKRGVQYASGEWPYTRDTRLVEGVTFGPRTRMMPVILLIVGSVAVVTVISFVEGCY